MSAQESERLAQLRNVFRQMREGKLEYSSLSLRAATRKLIKRQLSHNLLAAGVIGSPRLTFCSCAQHECKLRPHALRRHDSFHLPAKHHSDVSIHCSDKIEAGSIFSCQLCTTVHEAPEFGTCQLSASFSSCIP